MRLEEELMEWIGKPLLSPLQDHHAFLSERLGRPLRKPGFRETAERNPQGAIREQLPLARLYMGNAAIALRRPESALRILTEGIEKASDPRKGWVGYCRLRRGQAYDILGEREKALEDYRGVLQRKVFWYEDRDAKKGLKKAYGHEEVLALIEAPFIR